MPEISPPYVFEEETGEMPFHNEVKSQRKAGKKINAPSRPEVALWRGKSTGPGGKRSWLAILLIIILSNLNYCFLILKRGLLVPKPKRRMRRRRRKRKKKRTQGDNMIITVK